MCAHMRVCACMRILCAHSVCVPTHKYTKYAYMYTHTRTMAHTYTHEITPQHVPDAYDSICALCVYAHQHTHTHKILTHIYKQESTHTYMKSHLNTSQTLHYCVCAMFLREFEVVLLQHVRLPAHQIAHYMSTIHTVCV